MKIGFVQIYNFNVNDMTIKDQAFRLYAYLKTHHLDKSTPRYSLIQDELGRSERAIRYSLAALADAFLITKCKRGRKGLLNIFLTEKKIDKEVDRFVTIDNYIIGKKDLSDNAFRIYCFLRQHNLDDYSRETFKPSYKFMSRSLERSIRSVKDGISELEKHNLIIRKRNGFNGYLLLSFA